MGLRGGVSNQSISVLATQGFERYFAQAQAAKDFAEM